MKKCRNEEKIKKEAERAKFDALEAVKEKEKEDESIRKAEERKKKKEIKSNKKLKKYFLLYCIHILCPSKRIKQGFQWLCNGK